MRIYLAASFAEKDRMREIARLLREKGHAVSSTWHDLELPAGMRQADIEADPVTATHHGRQDLSEVRAAEALVLFTEAPTTTGGKHVEHGYALGLGKRLVIVGSPENVFQVAADQLFCKDEHDFFLLAERWALMQRRPQA